MSNITAWEMISNLANMCRELDKKYKQVKEDKDYYKQKSEELHNDYFDMIVSLEGIIGSKEEKGLDSRLDHIIESIVELKSRLESCTNKNINTKGLISIINHILGDKAIKLDASNDAQVKIFVDMANQEITDMLAEWNDEKVDRDGRLLSSQNAHCKFTRDLMDLLDIKIDTPFLNERQAKIQDKIKLLNEQVILERKSHDKWIDIFLYELGVSLGIENQKEEDLRSNRILIIQNKIKLLLDERNKWTNGLTWEMGVISDFQKVINQLLDPDSKLDVLVDSPSYKNKLIMAQKQISKYLDMEALIPDLEKERDEWKAKYEELVQKNKNNRATH